MADDLMQRVLAKRDKIAALPPEIRSAVINRLYDRVVSPKIPKSFGDDQKAALKTSFENSILGGSIKIDVPVRETDRKAVGQETGFQGRFHAGFDAGLANVAKLFEQGTGVALSGKGEAPSSAQLEEKAKLERQSTADWAKRHPMEERIARLGGVGLPAEPFMAAVPGGSLAANMVRGGLGMLPYDPSPSGAALGAGGAGLAHGLFRGLGRLGKSLPRPAGRAAAPTAAAPAGLEEFEKVARAKFGKSLNELSPQERMDAFNEWRSKSGQASADAAKAKQAAKQQAIKDAEAARVKAASAKVDEKVATRRAMDEAKFLQKNITAFVKQHKRAPNEGELSEIRRFVQNNPGANTTLHGESDIEAARRGASGEPPKESLPPNEVPENARASTQMMADQFKAANPEAIKAAQAVSEVAKQVAPIEAHIPEGQSGLSASEQKLMAKIDDAVTRMAEAKDPKVTAALQKTIANAKLGLQGNKEAMGRIADAERKAAERAKVVPAEETSSSLETAKDTRPNPEQALLGKEEDFQKVLTNLKAMGPKGEEAAKNIAMLVKAKRLTMEQLVQMLPKIEAGIKPKEGL